MRDLKTSLTKASATTLLSLGLLVTVQAGCSESDPSTELYTAVLETQEVEVGKAPQRLRFGVDKRTELEIPADVSLMPVRLRVSLVGGTVRRGQHPVNNTGLLVEPQALTFATPATIRQALPPVAPRRVYAAVVIPDNGDAFVYRSRGRRVSAADPALNGLEVWEGDGDSSGLWGFAEIADE